MAAAASLWLTVAQGHLARQSTPAIVAPAYAPLIVPAFLRSQDPANFVDRDGTRYFLTTDQIRASVVTPRLQTANRAQSRRVGPDLRPGEDAHAAFIFTSREDGQVYYLSSYGTCLYAADFDRVSDQAAAT